MGNGTKRKVTVKATFEGCLVYCAEGNENGKKVGKGGREERGTKGYRKRKERRKKKKSEKRQE